MKAKCARPATKKEKSRNERVNKVFVRARMDENSSVLYRLSLGLSSQHQWGYPQMGTANYKASGSKSPFVLIDSQVEKLKSHISPTGACL